MKKFVIFLLNAWVLLVIPFDPLKAAIEERVFGSLEQEEQYERLVTELRCPKCPNSNLAGSDAPIAVDLRQLIYDQTIQGYSEQDIVGFMIERYGEFVLFRPRIAPNTFLLWFVPPLLFVLGVFILLSSLKCSQKNKQCLALSDEECKKLQRHLSADI